MVVVSVSIGDDEVVIGTRVDGMVHSPLEHDSMETIVV